MYRNLTMWVLGILVITAQMWMIHPWRQAEKMHVMVFLWIIYLHFVPQYKTKGKRFQMARVYLHPGLYTIPSSKSWSKITVMWLVPRRTVKAWDQYQKQKERPNHPKGFLSYHCWLYWKCIESPSFVFWSIFFLSKTCLWNQLRLKDFASMALLGN